MFPVAQFFSFGDVCLVNDFKHREARARVILTSIASNGLISYTEVVILVSLVAMTLCNRFIYGEYRHVLHNRSMD